MNTREKLSENKDSFVNRVINPNAEDERQALNYFAEIFKKQPEYNCTGEKRCQEPFIVLNVYEVKPRKLYKS